MKEEEPRQGRHFHRGGPESGVKRRQPQSWALGWVLLKAAADSTKHTQRGVIAELRMPLHTRHPPPSRFLTVNDEPEWEVEKKKSLEEPDLFCMLNMACNLYSSECLIKSERKMKSHQPAHPFCCLLEGLFLR